MPFDVKKRTVIFSVVETFFTIVKSTKPSSSDTVYTLELNPIKPSYSISIVPVWPPICKTNFMYACKHNIIVVVIDK